METREYKTVWDLCTDGDWGLEAKGFKIKGGRRVYMDAFYNCSRNNKNCVISYLKPLPDMKVQQVDRYVDPSTEIELVK